MRKARILIGSPARSQIDAALPSVKRSVFQVEDQPHEFLSALWVFEPDLVVLDIEFPGLDGPTVLKVIRSSPKLQRIPVLVLVPRSADSAVREALALGADDVMALPFHPGEFSARVKSLLDRGFPYNASETLRARRIVTQTHTRRVSVDGRSVRLTPTEFDLLEALMRQSGRVLTKRSLAASLWAGPLEVRRHLLDCHMFNLRRKLGPASRRHIEIIPGVGYRFNA